MKAAIFQRTGPPEVLQYEEVSDPVCPPDGVLIRVEAISVEGGDTLHRLRDPLGPLPHIVGYQCAGSILEVGQRVTDRSPGQRVVCVMFAGSHAELAVAPASSSWVLPEGADLEKCACVPVAMGTAHDCLFEFGKLSAGESVLVQAGSGGVGLAAIQFAKRAGARVLATASSPEKIERLRAFGLDEGIDYRSENLVKRTRELTQGRGADLVVDPVGGPVLEASIAAAGYRGRIVTLGFAGRDTQMPDVRALMPQNKLLQGYFMGAELTADTQRVQQRIGGIIDDVCSGEIEAVIDRRFPLSEAAAAHRYIEERRAFGRVLLIP